MPSPSDLDSELSAVAAEIQALDPDGLRTAKVLRDTLDQLYDGQRTGRYRWDQLFKTEKTHCGTLVEINLQREFEFQDGTHLDYRIAGVEVDCKYSQKNGSWMIPPEARGHICLLMWSEDNENPKWSMGLVRMTPACLNPGSNRDLKATLNELGKNSIRWIFDNAALPPNVLLQLDAVAIERIMAETSGQKKINELFRSALGRVVGRAVVATVAQQDDYMKRVRANGGARTTLKKEGIIILGQYDSHAAVARTLGVPVPGQGESVSVRVTPAQSLGRGVAKIRGKLWKVASSTDPIVQAPELPRI
jgi:Restriction endonuclease NaeI